MVTLHGTIGGHVRGTSVVMRGSITATTVVLGRTMIKDTESRGSSAKMTEIRETIQFARGKVIIVKEERSAK